MACSKTKPTNWGSLATFFDNRSLPDQVPWGRWRHLLNAISFDAGMLCRRPGFRKYGAEKAWANADLHDQLLSLVGGYEDLPGEPGKEVITFPPPSGRRCGSKLTAVPVAEPITSIYVHRDSSGARRLIAGTQSRIYSQFNDGRWRILADGLGGDRRDPAIRFRFASCLQTVFAVNDVDEPRAHIIDNPVMGCGMQAFHPVPDLQAIGISKASVVASWKGVVFLADVVMDGVRVAHRTIWSNANAPFEWVPRDDSIAGFQDLDPGERILAAEVIADALFFFTDHSIWRVSFAATNATFLMQQVYFHKDGEGCIWARHSLAIWNNTAVYLGSGGIGRNSNRFLYFWTPYGGAPEAPEWLNLSTGSLNPPTESCDLVVAGYSTEADEYIISWPFMAGELPAISLACCLSRQVTSEIDHGFSAFAAVKLRFEVEFAEWLISAGICDVTTVNGWFPRYKSEPAPPPNPTPTPIQDGVLYSCRSLFVPEGFAVEDYTQPPVRCGRPVFCDILGQIDCTTPCPEAPLFLAASSTDLALKDLRDDYYARDVYVSGQLVAKPYGTRFRTGALDMGRPDKWKKISELDLFFEPKPTDQPRSIILRVGASSSPSDPLGAVCPIRWFQFRPRVLACPQPKDDRLFWPMEMEQRYLYLDLEILPVTGGAVCFSRMTADLILSAETPQ